jgi:hypothetical protein
VKQVKVKKSKLIDETEIEEEVQDLVITPESDITKMR